MLSLHSTLKINAMQNFHTKKKKKRGREPSGDTFLSLSEEHRCHHALARRKFACSFKLWQPKVTSQQAFVFSFKARRYQPDVLIPVFCDLIGAALYFALDTRAWLRQTRLRLASFAGLPTAQFFDRLQYAKTEKDWENSSRE